MYGNLSGNDRFTCESDQFPFPIIEDTNRMMAKKLGMIDSDQFDSKGCPLTARAVSSLYYFSALLHFSSRCSLLDRIKK